MVWTGGKSVAKAIGKLSNGPRTNNGTPWWSTLKSMFHAKSTALYSLHLPEKKHAFNLIVGQGFLAGAPTRKIKMYRI